MNTDKHRQGLTYSMMHAFGWAVKILIFLIVLGFALKNSQLVTLHYFLGYSWETPLVVLMLLVLGLGALLGMLALLPLIFRLQRERAKLRKQTEAMTDIAPTPSPIAD